MLARRFSLQTLREDKEGTVAVIFGFACIAMVGLIGLTIDGGRAMDAKTKTGAALDAAALAATRALFTSNPSDGDLETIARTAFEANIASAGTVGAHYSMPDLVIDRDTKTISMRVRTVVPTYFGGVFGVDSIDFDTATEASFNVRDIELSMALDITGSMGGQKIADLKVAAKDLVDILLPDNGAVSDVKIGLAPYSAAVNAGAAIAEAVTDGVSSNCVLERTGSEAYKDTTPDIGQWMGAPVAPLNDVDPFEGNSGYTCPTATVVALTSDKDELKDSIDTYAANGWTAGHLGTAWGWYLISPEWASIWPGGSQPRAYGTKNLIKAVVLMTDGVFNTAWRNGSSAGQAISVCDNMKAQNVVVYTVSFKSPNHPTLLNCASTDPTTGDPYYYDAANGTELREAFRDIAVKLTSLRLAK